MRKPWWVPLVRKSALSREPELLCDPGIYGNRAIGVRELDERSHTLRFALAVDPESVPLTAVSP
jgi:hypothetical protein